MTAQECDLYIKLFSTLSEARLLLHILCTRQAKPHCTRTTRLFAVHMLVTLFPNILDFNEMM